MIESVNLNAFRALTEWHVHQRYLTVLFFLLFYTLQSLPLPAQTLSNALYTSTVVSVFSTLNNPAELDNHTPKITTVLSLALLNYLFQDSLEKDNNSNLFPESSGYESLGYESLTSHKRAIQQTFREAFQKTEPLSRENNNGVKNARAETKIRYNNFLSASKKEKISENPYEENSEDFYEESRYLAWNAKKFQDCQEQAFELTVPFENDESSLSLTNLSIEENGETNLAIVSEFQFMPDLTLVYNCDNNQWMIMYPHQSGNKLTYQFTDNYGKDHDVELMPHDINLLHFKCLFCHNVCKNPVRCCKNEHIFCEKCLKRYREPDNRCVNCPTCRDSGVICYAVNDERTINELNVYCPSKGRGCDFTTTIGDLNDHYKVCVYALVNCEHDGCNFMEMFEAVAIHSEKCSYRKIQCVNFNDGYGCLDSVVFKNMDNHLKSCSHAIVDCENKERGCDVVIFRHQQEDHKKSCLFYRVHCPNGGCEYTCLQRELESHQVNECPEAIKSCPYCETALTRRTLEEHKKNCESRLERCLICSDEFSKKDYPSHVARCAEAKSLANPYTARHTEIYVHAIKRLVLEVEELQVKKQKLDDDQCSISSTCRATTERSEEEQPQESEQRELESDRWGWVREGRRLVRGQERQEQAENLQRQRAEVDQQRAELDQQMAEVDQQLAEVRRQLAEVRRQRAEIQ